MDQTVPVPVKLYIYDLSRGMARYLSPVLLGIQLDGIWHTAIVVHGQEFLFGGSGINMCLPGDTHLGPPDAIVDIGTTEISEEVFIEYLISLSQSIYRGDMYSLFEHNCNTFSNDVAQFLTGNRIPSHIINLPSEILATPFGQAVRPFLDSITLNPGGNNINHQR